MATVRLPQLAKVLNLSPRRCQQLVDEGMPKASRGQYDLGTCMQWYIRYLQTALQAKATLDGDGKVSNLTAERTRQARETAERMRLENAERRGDLISWDEVKALQDGQAQMLAEAFDSMPQRVSTDPKIQAKIDGELRAIRTTLAERFEAFAETCRRMLKRRADSEAAA